MELEQTVTSEGARAEQQSLDTTTLFVSRLESMLMDHC